MSRRAILIMAIIGLVLAVASGALFFVGIRTYDALLPSFAAVALSIAAAVFAGIVILGPIPTRRWFRVAIPLLSGLAAMEACYFLALTLGPKNDELVCYLDSANPGVCGPAPFDWTPVILGIVAFVLYLIAATLYGFAGQAQGVKVGARTGLLVLLLMSCIPGLNILGAIGFLIVAPRRTSAPESAGASD